MTLAELALETFFPRWRLQHRLPAQSDEKPL